MASSVPYLSLSHSLRLSSVGGVKSVFPSLPAPSTTHSPTNSLPPSRRQPGGDPGHSGTCSTGTNGAHPTIALHRAQSYRRYLRTSPTLLTLPPTPAHCCNGVPPAHTFAHPRCRIRDTSDQTPYPTPTETHPPIAAHLRRPLLSSLLLQRYPADTLGAESSLPSPRAGQHCAG